MSDLDTANVIVKFVVSGLGDCLMVMLTSFETNIILHITRTIWTNLHDEYLQTIHYYKAQGQRTLQQQRVRMNVSEYNGALRKRIPNVLFSS